MNFILKRITLQTATLCMEGGLFAFVSCEISIHQIVIILLFPRLPTDDSQTVLSLALDMLYTKIKYDRIRLHLNSPRG